ncbi:hypothetical protein BGZ46_010221, partial [Entomortierella lignicola]
KSGKAQHVLDWFSPPDSKKQAKYLSDLTDIGEKTFRTTLKFANIGVLDMEESTRLGRPKKVPDEEINTKIIAIVTELNNSGEFNSACRISNQLREDSEECGINRRHRSIIRDLHKLSLYWGKGLRRNILYDSPENVAYRRQYL